MTHLKRGAAIDRRFPRSRGSLRRETADLGVPRVDRPRLAVPSLVRVEGLDPLVGHGVGGQKTCQLRLSLERIGAIVSHHIEADCAGGGSRQHCCRGQYGAKIRIHSRHFGITPHTLAGKLQIRGGLSQILLRLMTNPGHLTQISGQKSHRSASAKAPGRGIRSPRRNNRCANLHGLARPRPRARRLRQSADAR